MTGFNNFNSFFSDSDSSDEDMSEMEELVGDYGCQVCEKNTQYAYFNHNKMEIIWFCSEKHRSSIALG